MYTFTEAQVAGMSPSLLSNHLKISRKSLGKLMEKIRVLPNGCWEWTGAKSKGYGVVKIRAIRATPLQVHRLCYELCRGKIEEQGIDVHHKVEDGCMGPACCNPDHLGPIERTRHFEVTPTGISYIHATSPTCINGHVYSVETMRMSPEGARRCLVCEKETAQRIRDKKLAAEGREKFRWRAEHKKTHCKRGHELVEGNLYWQGRYASCLTCRREYFKRQK